MASKRKRTWSPSRDARLRRQESGQRVPVSEDAVRSWRPEERATDEQMNVVLEALMERRRMTQQQIAEAVAEAFPAIASGTAQAATSASLLYFREAGWVRCVDPSRGAGISPVWEIVD